MAETPSPAPPRVVILHRGDPPPLTPDPWAAEGAERVERLAQAIASSAGWRDRPPATLVVRASPEPLIAAIGRFGDADVRWLEVAAQQAASVMPTIRLLDHVAVEAAIAKLAAALVNRFGRERLRTYRYAPVPRGGLLVLGTLSYLLDLPRERLASSPDAVAPTDDSPLVLVDDIAISGLRLSQAATAHPERPVVVATLHAHPDLRAAFIAAHTNVTAFVSAVDLTDHAPATMADGYDGWRARWHARAEQGALWVGQADHVVYPWNEPDLGVWNDVSGREERGWLLVPPDRCLKNRTTHPIDVQRMPEGSGHLRASPAVVAGELDGRIVVGHTGSATSFELDGVAADTWRALFEHGDPGKAAKHLAATYDVAVRDVAADVTAFVSDLLAAGLLVEADA
jgi:hypothetical protein